MTTYATEEDLIDRYGERLLVDLTDRGDVSTGVTDSDTIARALTDATVEVDGYLRLYKLPLTEIPPALVAITCALAIFQLHVHAPSEKIKMDYETAQRRLREISAGTFKLPIAGVEPDTSGSGGARTTDRERPFTETNLKGFI
jgi:phage gp36-like protein